MAADKANPKAGEKDFPAHKRDYSGFVRLLKISTIVTAIITAVVLLIISN
ncbi:MAG: aa3-type cytochrome c oxidase subunit IV [Sphingomonas bacterium]|nr:aa3-type cytochrome c oxidase subunit IV [Sphingomonas bacterium]